MYKVSLLPSEYRLVSRTARRKNRALLIASLTMVALFMVYFVLSANTMQKDNELIDIKLQSEALDQRIADYLFLEDLNKEVHAMLDKTMAAYGTSPSWHKIIALIGNSVPNSVGLTALDMKLSEGVGECTVQGTAGDVRALTQWLETLGTLSGVGDVRYSFSSKDGQEMQGDMQFELSITLLPGEGYQIIMQEDGNE